MLYVILILYRSKYFTLTLESIDNRYLATWSQSLVLILLRENEPNPSPAETWLIVYNWK